MKYLKKVAILAMVALIANISLFAYGADTMNTSRTQGVSQIMVSDSGANQESAEAIVPTVVILTALALAAICHGTHRKYVATPDNTDMEAITYEMSLLD